MTRSSNGTLKVIDRSQAAFLGLAFGDALGWPQEDRAHRISSRTEESNPGSIMRDWARWSGGRFFAHQEVIKAGEYSDDTQLALATARSLLLRERWWKHFTSVELPFWTVYERGGGGATKRAADAWLQGRALWSDATKPEDRERYFGAGGNGVAMRILPHCIADIGAPFGAVADKVIANGISTHGHPRALIGALVYAYACHSALQQFETLPYGGLVARALDNVGEWSRLSAPGDVFEEWLSAADVNTRHQYRQLWNESVAEMVALLAQCADAIGQGVLAVDRDVLEGLGCFGRAKGAGTVAAAAALFLASRHAADPMIGVLGAAFAQGSDADTIASMTGGLLGTIAGHEWLDEHSSTVQDSEYLKTVARMLLARNTEGDSGKKVLDKPELKRGDIQAFMKRLSAADAGSSIALPDGRRAQVGHAVSLKTRSTTTRTTQWQMAAEDGQSIFIKSVSREGKNASQSEVTIDTKSSVGAARVSIKMLVKNLDRSRLFYSSVIGLPITKETSTLITLGGALALFSEANGGGMPESDNNQERRLSIVACESPDIEAVYERVKRAGARIVTALSSPRNVHRVFRCHDPDGNLVEVYQLNGGQMLTSPSRV